MSIPGFFEGLSWSFFRDIEDKVIASTKYVELATQNLEVFSIEFANFLFQISTNLEATFKAMLHSPCLSEDSYARGIREKELRGDDLNISDYREIFEKFYHLSQCEVVVAPQTLRLVVRPFDGFQDGKSPVWWKTYNEVKHDLSMNFKKATLRMVLDSLSGLFLLNVVHLDARNFLIENKILKEYDTEYQSTAGPYKAEQLKKRYSTLHHFEIEVPDSLVFVSKLLLFQPAGCKENWDQKNLYWFRYL